MWLVLSSIIIILFGIIFQDFKSRSVYALWFPALIILFIINHLILKQSINDIGETALINLSFLGLQFLMVTVYFSLKQRSRINITEKYLGWGDILFLICITFYLSTFNFLLFYILSLFITLIAWIIWIKTTQSRDKRVPLAGFQAALLTLLIIADQLVNSIDLTSDIWLLSYLSI